MAAILALLMVLLSACSGPSVVVTEEGQGRVHVMETKRDASALGTQTTMVRSRWCDGRQVQDGQGFQVWETSGCVDDGPAQFFSTQGWLISLFQPAAIGAGIAGAGLAMSGSDDSVNVNQSQNQQATSRARASASGGVIDGGSRK